MKRILKWLETKFSRHSAGASVPGRVESHGPGKDIQMPNIYDCDDPFKKQQLKTLDQSSLDTSESIGIDPYNSGSFDSSKTRSHK